MNTKWIFRKEKYLAAARSIGLSEETIQSSLGWIDECDGKEVILDSTTKGNIVGTKFGAHINWCEEVSASE